MSQSETIASLAAAMAAAQPQIDGARKDSANPFFKSKYADLASVTAAVQPIFGFGLCYIQRSHDRPDAAAIETIILHESGEWMSAGIVSVPVSKQDAQGYGSALTYARRYSLGAAFGIVPEDDDGNAAAKAAPKKDPNDIKVNLYPEFGDKKNRTPTEAQDKAVADFCAAIETADTVEALKDAWEGAYKVVSAWDMPMMVNLIEAAKNKRKRELAAKEK